MYKLLLLALLSFKALGLEVVNKYSYIDQSLFNEYTFKHHVMSVGLRVPVGPVVLEGTYGSSISDSPDRYKVSIKDITSLSVLYPIDLTESLSFMPKVGYTDYESEWKYKGRETHWSPAKDNDWHWGLGLEYSMDSYSLGLEYVDYYRKNKEGKGSESTTGISLYLTYSY